MRKSIHGFPLLFYGHGALLGSFRPPELHHYANLVTDDVISVNNEAMLLKLGRTVAPYQIYQIVICIIGKLEYLWNKERYHKIEMPFYSTLKSLLNKHIFKMNYFSGHLHFKLKVQEKSISYAAYKNVATKKREEMLELLC